MPRGIWMAGLALLALARPVASQTTGSVTTTLNVGTILSISVSNLDVLFPSPQASDWTAGFVTAGTSSQVSHKGNVRHGVHVRANAPTMTATATGPGEMPRTDKPASDVQVRINGAGWQGLSSTTAIGVVSNAVPGQHVNAATIDYRLLLSTADVAGTYTLGFTFTVVAQ